MRTFTRVRRAEDTAGESGRLFSSVGLLLSLSHFDVSLVELELFPVDVGAESEVAGYYEEETCYAAGDDGSDVYAAASV